MPPPSPITSLVSALGFGGREHKISEGEFMRVGFVVTRRAQEIEVQISAPENNDQSALVTYSRAGDSFALLMGRLYYRSDRLAELLGICAPEALRESQGNDAALVLAVYRHLGRAALERLEGDFALVLWDAQNTELIGLRDPLEAIPSFGYSTRVQWP